MRLVLPVLLLLIFASVSFASLSVRYAVYLDHTDSGYVRVRIDAENSENDTLYYQMPAWAPGAYAMTNYGRFVDNFKVFDEENRPLGTERLNENRWRILGKKKYTRFEYRVRNSFKDSTSLYFALCHIDSEFFFANATALFGYVNDVKDIPLEVNYLYPYGWEVHTSLDTRDTSLKEFRPPGGGLIFFAGFKAKNYDELVDAPVMAGKEFWRKSFMLGDKKISICLHSDRKFDMDSLRDLTKKIVESETAFFRDTPFSRYVFLVNAPTFMSLPSIYQGALEHANSSAYLLVNLPWENFKQFGPHIISHEFFHLWNVKRIHSSLLGPFDYTRRVKTTSLWLSEGITDYYSYTLLARSGIISPRTFYSELADLVSKNMRSTGNKSLEALSIAESDFHIDDVNAFYYKGTLAGLMLDLEIRTRTKNKKSLDDVTRALNAEAKQGKTFKDKDLFPKIEKMAGVKMRDFYKKYIAGTEPFPLEGYLRKMGLQYVKREQYGSDILPDPAAGTLERAIRKDIAGE
jgi:predicted metalloprotease with PDZ domain